MPRYAASRSETRHGAPVVTGVALEGMSSCVGFLAPKPAFRMKVTCAADFCASWRSPEGVKYSAALDYKVRLRARALSLKGKLGAQFKGSIS